MVAMNDSSEKQSVNEQQVTSESLTLGQYLRKEREKKQWSIEELREKTGINLTILHALEHDQRHELPADVFVRGLIKLYTKTLDLDPQYALTLFHSKKSSASKEAESIVSKDILSSESLAESPLFTRTKLLLCLLLVLLGIVAYIVYRYQPTLELKIFSLFSTAQTTSSPAQENQTKLPDISTKSPQTHQELEGQPQSVAAAAAQPAEVSPTKTVDTTVVGSSEATATEPAPEAEVESTPQSKSTDVPRENAIAEEDGTHHTLTATFTEMTWVRTVIDNDEAKEAFFRPGSSATWQAKEKIEILLGNSGGASLLFDGTPIDLKGKNGKVIRLTLP